MKPLKRLRRVAAFTSALFLVGWSLGLGTPAQADPVHHHTRIEGSGSSWAAVAVDHWDSAVAQQGVGVDFNPNGSAQGRRDYAQYQNDFAVSDIGYQGTDPVTGAGDSSSRPYVYLPIVAGGTAFPYQVRVRGQLLRTLRLSGETLAKIFTLQITNWNDPQITRDNNGHALPSLPIIPVVHSEGSGSTYMFTRYLSKVYPSIWNSKFHPGPTEYFNRIGNQVAENGSDSVMNFITSAAANGAIGYDEYAYALNQSYPVAKVLNAAGYYTLPNQYNVAVALTQAVINMNKSSPDYLLQNLDRVYGYNDKRVYPVSSYSYMIIPTSPTDSRMAHSYKRQTIADYLYYDICRGQAPIGELGYSSLPINLVEAGFGQIAKLHTADPTVVLTNENVATCNNPTFIAGHPERNYLAEIAPYPPACDKQGAGPCTGTGDIGLETPGQLARNGGQNNGGNGPVSNGGTGSGPGSGGTGPGGGVGPGGSGSSGPGSTGPGGTGSASTASAAAAGTHINPNTGQLVSGSAGSTSAAADGQSPAANPSTLGNAESPAVEYTLGIIAAVLLLGALIAPPLVAHNTRRREGGP